MLWLLVYLYFAGILLFWLMTTTEEELHSKKYSPSAIITAAACWPVTILAILIVAIVMILND